MRKGSNPSWRKKSSDQVSECAWAVPAKHCDLPHFRAKREIKRNPVLTCPWPSNPPTVLRAWGGMASPILSTSCLRLGGTGLGLGGGTLCRSLGRYALSGFCIACKGPGQWQCQPTGRWSASSKVPRTGNNHKCFCALCSGDLAPKPATEAKAK